MSDESSVTIDLHETMPLVQSSSSINNANGNGQINLPTTGNNKSQASTPQTPTANMSGSSFIVATKANLSIISDAPVFDTGVSSNKQVITTCCTVVILVLQNQRNFYSRTLKKKIHKSDIIHRTFIL